MYLKYMEIWYMVFWGSKCRQWMLAQYCAFFSELL